MGDFINVLIDDLQALLFRLLGLPVVFQIILWVSIWSLMLAFFFRVLGVFREKPVSSVIKALVFTFSGISMVVMVFAAAYDHREFLHEQERAFSSRKPVVTIERDPLDSTWLSKQIKLLKGLSFAGTTDVNVLQQSAGIVVLQIGFSDPLIQGFLAYVDLEENSVALDTAITVKERVSTFAKRYKASLAVNGEAGTTPGMLAPLGQWTGNYMVEGKLLKLEDGPRRPMIWFDRKGVSYYSKEADVVAKLPDQAYNAIWGRFDLLLGGESAISRYDYTRQSHYPRTIVGMDKSGKRMILMVVDGRRPLYSKGMTMSMCAETMLAAGAWNAMACDQGGSSEMWSAELGVVNEPSDGFERPVYTHLGFKSRGN